MSSGVANRLGLRGSRLDVSGAVLGLLLAILLFPLRFLSDAIHLQVIPILLGLGSALYLVSLRYGRDDVHDVRWQLTTPTAVLLRAVSLVGLSALVLVGVVADGRSLGFLLVATAVAALIFGQILFVRDDALRPGLVLAQILALAVIVRFTALLTTPGVIGVDGWTHVTTYAQAIHETGELAAISDSKYYGAPLYHLLVATSAAAFGTSIQTALYLTLGLAMPLSMLLVYHASRYVFPVRWSLFAIAAYAVGDHVVRWGIRMIPTSLGLLFFLGVFFLVTKLFFTEERLPVYLLALFLGFAVVLTHQISVFVTLTFLGAGVVAQGIDRFYGTRSDDTGQIGPYGGTVNLAWLTAGLAVITLLNWSLTPYQSGSFLTTMLDWLWLVLSDSAGFLALAGETPAATEAVASTATTVPATVEFVDSLGFFALLVVFVLGALTLLRSEVRTQLSLTYVVSAGIMLVFALGFPLFGIDIFLPGRWYAFMYVPMVVVGVAGLQYLATRLPSRAVLAGLVLLAVVFPGGMFVASSATPENPVFEQHHVTYAYDDAELAGAETVSDIHPESAPTIHTDHPYRTIFDRWQNQEVRPLTVADDGSMTADAVVYRTHQSEAVVVARYAESWIDVQVDRAAVCDPTQAVLYSNGDVQYCRTAGV